MQTFLAIRNTLTTAVTFGFAAAASASMAAAATVVSETPFQQHVQLTCVTGNSSCSAIIGPVANKQRLIIQFVSCTGDGETGSTLRNFAATVQDGMTLIAKHYIAPTYRSPEDPYTYIASQPILLTVSEGRILILSSVSIGGTFGVACGISGVRQRLQ